VEETPTFFVSLPFPVLANKYERSEEFDQGQLHILYSEEPEKWVAVRLSSVEIQGKQLLHTFVNLIKHLTTKSENF
jgi:hypothetical protein